MSLATRIPNSFNFSIFIGDMYIGQKLSLRFSQLYISGVKAFWGTGTNLLFPLIENFAIFKGV